MNLFITGNMFQLYYVRDMLKFPSDKMTFFLKQSSQHPHYHLHPFAHGVAQEMTHHYQMAVKVDAGKW